MLQLLDIDVSNVPDADLGKFTEYIVQQLNKAHFHKKGNQTKQTSSLTKKATDMFKGRKKKKNKQPSLAELAGGLSESKVMVL
jgi:flagellin-specific chaperone FliS